MESLSYNSSPEKGIVRKYTDISINESFKEGS